ncbi:hypothetical protein GCM10010302_18350 [Streptomyces polychromogenes]|uniref:Secreted protein n=1 Tax=Streptomyces polychromogenes TaxID=67342 RepID=A0ABP3EW20_9ACTN
MRTRLLGLATAAMVVVLGLMGPAAQAAAAPRVSGDDCVTGGGSVQYDSIVGQWTCIGGTHADEPIN